MRSFTVALIAAACVGYAVTGSTESNKTDRTAPTDASRYPTAVIADYVLGCMISNGTSSDTLRKCACSFDFVAESIPYKEYEQVESLLRLQQMPGVGRNAVYKNANWAKQAIAHLREVQAESTLRCF